MSQAIRDVVIRLSVEQLQTAIKAPEIAPILQAHVEVAKSAEKWGKYEEGAVSSINFHRIKMAEVAALRERKLNEERAKEFSETLQRETAERRRALEQQMADEEEAAKKEMDRTDKRSEAIADMAESGLKFMAMQAAANKLGGDDSDASNKFLETSLKAYSTFKLVREQAEKIAPALGMSSEATGTLLARMNAVGVALGVAYVAAKGVQQAFYVGSGMAEQNAKSEILDRRLKTGVVGSESPFATPEQQKAGQAESDIRLKHNDSIGYWISQKMQGAAGWLGRQFDSSRDAIFGEGSSYSGKGSIGGLVAKQGERQTEEILKRTHGFEERFSRGELDRSKLTDEKALLEIYKQQAMAKEEMASLDSDTNYADKGATDERRAQVAQAMLQFAREEAAIKQRQLQTQGEMVAKQEQIYKLAKQSVEDEQKRISSAKEAGGRMGKADQTRAMILARKIREGNATDADYQDAEKLIPSQLLGDRAKKHFEQKGDQFTRDLNNALGNEPLEGRGSALEAKQEDLENQEGLLEMYKERNAELKEAFKDLMETIKELNLESSLTRQKLRERAAQN